MCEKVRGGRELPAAAAQASTRHSYAAARHRQGRERVSLAQSIDAVQAWNRSADLICEGLHTDMARRHVKTLELCFLRSLVC